MKDVIVVGGGAAGLVAAIAAAEKGAKVLIIEKNDRVGKKLLATGNGRCNLWNTGPALYNGDEAFALATLSALPLDSLESFFSSLGLALGIPEDGRVYPASGLATAVLDVLRLGCQRLHVEIRCGEGVTALRKEKVGYTVVTSAGEYHTHRIIVTGGGKASPKLSGEGCYRLLTALGHRLITPKPALTPLQTETEPIRGLEGIRTKACLTLKKGGRTIKEADGEALFTEYGVSGIAAMSLARDWEQGMLHISFLPALNIEKSALRPMLASRRSLMKGFPLEDFFTGLFHKRLGAAIFRHGAIGPLSRPCEGLTDAEVDQIASLITDFPLAITDTQGFAMAQVTAGGIATEEFDPHTLESRLHPGLYAAGELLNVDGECGGHNLRFAFTTGILAGRSAGAVNQP